MKITLKQLTKGGETFFPLTSAEAVLVKRGSTVITLDKVLPLKIEAVETPVDSGLSAVQTGQVVVITHANPSVEPNDTLEPLLIQHDSKGHIVKKKTAGKFTILVEGKPLVETNGSEDKSLIFGDDFTTNGTNVNLRWNNI